jgi:YjbE family integral membrane protein
MDILSAQFFTSLFAIIVIDLMLAGDNAIVIALAARRLPPRLQKRAIFWGMFGAVAVRSSMTLIVVWLLQIPGLLLAGGLVLIWIAYKLLLPDREEKDGHEASAPSTFWGAMQTIVIADAVMGLDNVLGVAGAAHGSYLLVVIGLLISIPIVVWGSSVLLHWVERFPVIVYFGSGVLAWTAVKMIVSEPLLKPTIDRYPVIVPLSYMVVVLGVLWVGLVKNHRVLESRIRARLDALSRAPGLEHSASVAAENDAVRKLLVPVAGSPNDDYAIRQVISEFLKDASCEVHLLNVRTPLSRHIAQFLKSDVRDDFHSDEAEKALKRPRELLDEHRIPYAVHVRKGERARTIVDEAKRLGCDRIVMTTARKNSLTRMLEDSTTSKVLELTSVPVEIVAGSEISKFERFGIPLGVVAALATLLMVALG